MVNKIIKFILSTFGGLTALKFGKEILVLIISIMPILELRGGLIAAALLKLDPVASYIICMVGNILPIPFILWFIKEILEWMKKTKHLKSIELWLEKKVNKNKGKIEKYGYWGLTLFVAIPFPGTGAWTGCLIAALLDLDKKKSLKHAIIGVFIASVIMMILSFGLLKSII